MKQIFKRIMVVEDTFVCAMPILDAEALNERGYKVVHARDGEEALKQVEKQYMDVIVADLRLPGINGVELCQRLRTKRPGIRIVGMTAYSQDPSVEAFRCAGADPCLFKPFDMDELLAVISLKLRRKMLISRAEAERIVNARIRRIVRIHKHRGLKIKPTIYAQEAREDLRKLSFESMARRYTIVD